jgi:hypothetical protein
MPAARRARRLRLSIEIQAAACSDLTREGIGSGGAVTPRQWEAATRGRDVRNHEPTAE